MDFELLIKYSFQGQAGDQEGQEGHGCGRGVRGQGRKEPQRTLCPVRPRHAEQTYRIDKYVDIIYNCELLNSL